MSKEIPLKLIVGTVSNEKGVSEEVIFQAVEAALVSATKKKHGADIDVRVAIDRKSGTYDTFRRWTVVEPPEEGEELEFPEQQILVADAKAKDPALNVGDVIEEPMESVEFGRIAAQTAKQVIIQKVRDAERALVADEFKSKVGTLVTGSVKKITRDALIIDLGNNAEALLKKDQLLPRESVRLGDRVRSYLVEVEPEARGPQIILSRTCSEMLIELFKLEVPEVGEGIIEIKSAARDPGQRAKIAVKTNDGRMDPVGACVGMRGARVQAVSNELNGERVDIILWDDNPAQLVMNAMAPAEVQSIVVDDETHTMDIAVGEEHLSQAIGRSGQNVKLASSLTGWELNVLSEKQAMEQTEQEQGRLRNMFTEKLVVDDEVADVLIETGFSSLEEVAYVPAKEMLQIDGFDEEIVEDLRQRAKDAIEAEATSTADSGSTGTGTAKPAEDLFEVEGITQALAEELAKHNIATRDDLAEQAVNDLTAITQLNEDEAAKLIMAARAHWFADEQ